MIFSTSGKRSEQSVKARAVLPWAEKPHRLADPRENEANDSTFNLSDYIVKNVRVVLEFIPMLEYIQGDTYKKHGTKSGMGSSSSPPICLRAGYPC